MKKLFTILSALLITAPIWAQSPEKMSYQSVIRNASDQLVTNQDMGMQISILQGSSSGTSVYVETHSSSSNANGLVTIEIGTGATSDDFAAIDWENGPYFLKTETDPTEAGGTNYTITGTSQLLSVPYALYAKTAGTADYNNLTNLPVLNIANWDNAYSWDDHSTAGYLTFEIDGSITNEIQALSISNDTVYLSNGGFVKLPTDIIKDADSDTKIQVEKNADEDIIRFDLGGTEKWLMTGNRLEPMNSGYSIMIGDSAGFYSNPVTANYNTFIGYQAGMGNTTGDRNIFIGYHSGRNADSPGLEDNIFIGDSAGLSNNSYGNIFIGKNAGENNHAYNNIYIGKNCGKNGSAGLYNTYIGTDVGMNSTGSLNTFVGSYCASSNTTGQYNVFMGTDAGRSNTQGSFNVFLGEYCGGGNVTGNNNVFVGYNARSGSNSAVNAVAIGYQAYSPGDNQAVIGNFNTISVGSYVDWSNLSDKRFKTNVQENVIGLDFIMKLEPVTYNLDLNKLKKFTGNIIDVNVEKTNTIYTGFLAQDVEKAAKELAYNFSGVDIPQNEKDGTTFHFMHEKLRNSALEKIFSKS